MRSIYATELICAISKHSARLSCRALKTRETRTPYSKTKIKTKNTTNPYILTTFGLIVFGQSDKTITCGLYHPNYEIWANKGKYRLKTANISRFWLIFFDFENILRNNYAPFGCNYAPDWCIFFAPCHHKNRGNKRAEI